MTPPSRLATLCISRTTFVILSTKSKACSHSTKSKEQSLQGICIASARTKSIGSRNPWDLPLALPSLSIFCERSNSKTSDPSPLMRLLHRPVPPARSRIRAGFVLGRKGCTFFHVMRSYNLKYRLSSRPSYSPAILS